MKHRSQDLRDEVIRQNRMAAGSLAEAPLEDPDVMYVLESAVGTDSRRVYELSLGKVIAKLAEELARTEAQLEALKSPLPARRGRGKVRAC